MASLPSAIHLDARGSPAQALAPELLECARSIPRPPWHGKRVRRFSALEFDGALRWLAASDRIISDQAARALCQVKDERLHVKEGHGRWSSYIRAYVPMTQRWCQQEIKRMRDLAHYPLLAAAWSEGSLSKSHLRAVLRVVTPGSESEWHARALSSTVRRLEEQAASARDGAGATGETCQDRAAGELTEGNPCAGAEASSVSSPSSDESRPHRRVVMAPPRVAALVARAVEVARKVEGYQVGAGVAITMMADETMAGLHSSSQLAAEVDIGTNASTAGAAIAGDVPRVHSLLGDQQDLVRELGHAWEEIQEHFERAAGGWPDLEWRLADIHLRGVPADDAGAHERVVFWTGLAERLDAVRGRLLRVADDRLHSASLGFASFGHYVRERMGLSLREARDLVRLDKALDSLPVALRMYAAGRLGKRAAWLVSRVATRQTDRAWTRFAMTHTSRFLEVVVETAQLKRDIDPTGWARDGGLPPEHTTFADAIRACSLLKADGPSEPTVRIAFYLDAEEREVYEQTVVMLRAVAGGDKQEWYCLAVMAQHFLNCHAGADTEAVPVKLRRMMHRRVIERGEYTCQVPECLMRGHLEADHMTLRSHGGPTVMENLVPLCFMDHRFMKHQARSVKLWGEAPGNVFVGMGSRVYLNDLLIQPMLSETVLDDDPWALSGAEDGKVAAKRGSAQ